MLDSAGDGDESHFHVSHFQELDENQEGKALARKMGRYMWRVKRRIWEMDRKFFFF